MKTLTPLLLLWLVLLFSCEEDDTTTVNAPTPSNLALQIEPTSDNSGLVSFTPTGTAVSIFQLDFGNGAETVEVSPGETVSSTYDEGSYEVILTGIGLSGESVTMNQPLDVTFRAPENVELTINQVDGDPFTVEVSASADYEANFVVDFGDDSATETFVEGESVAHTYSDIGEYVITVTAESGGNESATVQETIQISNPLLLPINFEDDKQDYSLTDFEGATTSLVENPDPSDANNSETVISFEKADGSPNFAGTIVSLDEVIDFSKGQNIKVDVWSPKKDAIVKLKLENASNSDISFEVDQRTTTENEWEELLFDLSSFDLSQEYSKVILFFDFENNGDGSTYYFDNIEQTEEGTLRVEFPIDFESQELEYSFNAFAGASAEVVENPSASDNNSSNRVAKMVKSDGAQTFAGATLETAPINFEQSSVVSMLSYSPRSGVPILLKIEDLSSPPDNNGNPSVFAEVTVNTQSANEWETLSFDFSTFDGFDPNGNWDRIVIFYDFGAEGTGDTYYFDLLQTTEN